MPPSTGPVPVTGRARRVLQDDARPSFFTSAIDGAPRWGVGVLAALQGAALSLLVLAVPAVAVFVATSADPSNADVAWTRAVVVAAHLWLLAHGVPAPVGGAEVTLVPLGLTLLAAFTCAASARRSGVATRSGALASVAAYALLAALVALVCGTGGGGVLRALLGGLVVGGVGLGRGLLRRPEAPALGDLLAPVAARVPTAVLVGLRAGTLAVATLVAVAALLTAVWVVAGRATVADVVGMLGLDAVGGVVLAVAELAYLPNLVVWVLAWLAGPGFAVGAGTRFAPAEVVAGPLPAVPMLGALPAPDLAGGALVAVPAVLVAVGLLAGSAVHRWLVPVRVRDVLTAVGVVAGTSGLLAAVLQLVAGGAAGAGRMAEVGGSAALVGLVTAAGVGVGALLLAVPADTTVRAAVRERWHRRRGAGTTAADDGAEAG
ncbi:cell division protein PerM [Cellulomonas telluris]|uniref:cell division protein PerM n=1 Tax=Cellulomonas telluris TaxID=2306636 RepID=UPI0010A915B7|nr:DUF6350 family protein [Cellulomonas telluris]